MQSSYSHSTLTICISSLIFHSARSMISPLILPPTPLVFFVVFMSHHIKPQSIDAYLSGICNTLKPHFPHVCSTCNSSLVSHSLAGMRKLHCSTSSIQKPSLTPNDLSTLLSAFDSPSHNNFLFLAMLFTGFTALLCLGEMTISNSPTKHSSKKIPACHTLSLLPAQFSFHLPFTKLITFIKAVKLLSL